MKGNFQDVNISSVIPSLNEQQALSKALNFVNTYKYEWGVGFGIILKTKIPNNNATLFKTKLSIIKSPIMKSLKTLLFLAFIFLLFCFAQCKKKYTPLTITLYDKPLGTIQSYIQGKWKLEYEMGGICASCKNYFNNVNYLWQFNSSNRIKQTYNDTVFADTTIKWIKDVGIYSYGDSTFVMNFYDKRGYPSAYVVNYILNDTLILYDAYSVDAVFYYFTK